MRMRGIHDTSSENTILSIAYACILFLQQKVLLEFVDVMKQFWLIKEDNPTEGTR